MGRRSNHTHFDTGQTVTRSWGEVKVAACGNDGSWMDRFTDQVSGVSCPKCSKVLALAAIKERGSDIEASRCSDYGYRFTYEVSVGGELVGYAVCDGGGAGVRWYVTGIAVQDDDSYRPSYKMTDGKDRYPRDLSWFSKEAAMLAMIDMVEKGRLEPLSKVIEDTRAYRERMNQRAAERVRFEEERAERREETMMGLKSILERAERGELTLTNMERAAAANVIKDRGGEV